MEECNISYLLYGRVQYILPYMEECNILYHIWKSAIYRTIYGRVQYVVPYMEECNISYHIWKSAIYHTIYGRVQYIDIHSENHPIAKVCHGDTMNRQLSSHLCCGRNVQLSVCS